MRSRPLGRLGTLLLVVFVLGVTLFMFIFGETMEHIPDINGEADRTLATITEADVIACQMGAAGGPNKDTKKLALAGITLSESVRYYSKEFSGVSQMSSEYYFAGSTVEVILRDFEVTAGNFQIFVVCDDQIIGTIEPAEEAVFRLENAPAGQYRLIIAGESAAFTFTSSLEDRT